MKKVLFVLLLSVLLVACGDGEANDQINELEKTTEELTQVDKSIKDQAKEIAEMTKDIYESNGKISDDDLQKFEEFLDINEIDGRELTIPEITIQNGVITLTDFLTDQYVGDSTFEEEYQWLMDKVNE